MARLKYRLAEKLTRDPIGEAAARRRSARLSLDFGRRILRWVSPLLLGLAPCALLTIPGAAGVRMAIACAAASVLVAVICYGVYPRMRSRFQVEGVSFLYHAVILGLVAFGTLQTDPDFTRSFFMVILVAGGVFFRVTAWYLAVLILGVVLWRGSYAFSDVTPAPIDWIRVVYLSPFVGLMVHGAVRRYAGAMRDSYLRRNTELARMIERLEQEARDRERAEQELRRTQGHLDRQQRLESLGLLAGGIAHDFNNLLVGVLGRASLLRSGLHEPEDRDNLEAIERSARQAAELCEHLLAFTGGRPTDSKPTDLNELILQLERLMFGILPANVTVERQLGEALPPVALDRPQIQKVLLNLLVNAGEAMQPGGGTVWLRTRVRNLGPADFSDDPIAEGHRAGEYVVLEVEDEGQGMDAETQARAFEPFFTTKPDGRGLGLATALGTVRAHRGSIQLESTPRAGTRFEIAFPAGDGVVADDLSPRIGDIETTTTAASTVLVVDDETCVREFLDAALTSLGCRVETASDATTGLARMTDATRHYDAVFLDMVMPDGNGVDVLRQARAHGFDAPVILTSGYSRSHALNEADSGVAFLQKPYGMRELATVLRGALATPAAEATTSPPV